MGINNLYKILRKYSPNSFKTIPLKDYAYKKVAIDTNLYMYKYKVIFGEDDWLRAFTNLVCCLRKNDIHPIFIMDSQAPIEKLEEQQNRRKERQKLKDKLELIEQDYKIYLEKGEISDLLKEISSSDKKHPKLLIKNSFNETTIINKINTLKSQTISINKEDFEKLRSLLKVMEIPCFNATSEAEATCSYLNINNKVDAVLTEDTDVLAYGAPVFLSGINTHNETIVEVKIESLLENLNLNQKEFTDMCIMCGTDYNKNIPKVGPMKSHALITQYKSIEEIEKNTSHDISILKHIRSRELFSFSDNYFDKDIHYCPTPNIHNINKFLLINNCRIDMSYIAKCLNHTQIIFK